MWNQVLGSFSPATRSTFHTPFFPSFDSSLCLAFQNSRDTWKLRYAPPQLSSALLARVRTGPGPTWRKVGVLWNCAGRSGAVEALLAGSGSPKSERPGMVAWGWGTAGLAILSLQGASGPGCERYFYGNAPPVVPHSRGLRRAAEPGWEVPGRDRVQLQGSRGRPGRLL